MLLFKNNGITKNPKKFKKNNLGPWYYEQQSLGYNFRMNDVQASLGLSQLNRINEMLKKEIKLQQFIKKNLKVFQ